MHGRDVYVVDAVRTPVGRFGGALAKVLASECYVKKGGGFYSWDSQHPWAVYWAAGSQAQIAPKT